MTELSGRSVEKHQICCVASVLLVCRVQEIVSNALSLLKLVPEGEEEKERGALVIISCHTKEVLEEISDEIFKMDQGRITDHIVCS